MKQDLIELLACPRDGAYPLRLERGGSAEGPIDEGTLVCMRCGSRFPISAGIPIFLDLGDDEESKIKQQEIRARDASHSRSVKDPSEYVLERACELDAVRRIIGSGRNQTVLDAGCGSGYMTQAAGRAARVVGIDFSPLNLRNFRSMPGPRVDLLQGDVCHLPIRPGYFDTVMSCQVLEHIPTPDSRKQFLGQLPAMLKENGRLVLTVYNWHSGRKEKGVPKEGFHENGIFFHCYVPDELEAELSGLFRVDALLTVNILLPRTFRVVKALGRHRIYWDRLWRGTRVAQAHGELLLALCVPR